VKLQKIFTILMVATIILSGCSTTVETEPDEPIEVVIWNTWSDHHVEAFQKILDDFNAEHPNIIVVQQPQPLADFSAKVMQAVREGEGPDIINTFPSEASNYIDEGLIVNLSEYIDDPDIGIPGFKDKLPAAAYETVTQWDGNVFLLPLALYGEVFYINNTLFDELGLAIPTTWKELEEAGRVIYEETGKPAFGFDSEIDGFQVLIMQNGSGYINTDTMTVEYNNPIAVEQLDWFCGLVQEGVFRLVGEDVYFSNPFGSQAVASYIGSPAGIGFVESAVDDQFEFTVQPIPQSGVEDYVSDWGNGYIIFTSTEARQKAAFEFLKYMRSPEVLSWWGTQFGVPPAYEEAVKMPVFQEYLETNLAMKAAAEQMDRTGHLPSVKGSAAIRNILGRAVASACTGVLTPQEALDIAEQEGNAELSQNN